MSLRQQAKILGVDAGHLSRMINGKRPWNPDLYDRYRHLVGNTFGNTILSTDVKSTGQQPLPHVAHSSSGLGHRPLKAEITGSNPVCATTKLGCTVRSSRFHSETYSGDIFIVSQPY